MTALNPVSLKCVGAIRGSTEKQRLTIPTQGTAIARFAELRGFDLRLARGEHLGLVAISLLAGIVVAIPLGILAAHRPKLGQVILSVIGIIQTIPSLARLGFLIPWFGIGAWPALVALLAEKVDPVTLSVPAPPSSAPSWSAARQRRRCASMPS